MKKLVNISILFLAISLLSYTPSFSQDTTEFNVNQRISLDNDSEPREIEIKCKEGIKNLNIKIISAVYRGSVKIEVIDPNGKKKENFEIKSHIPIDQPVNDLNRGDTVNGSINKSIENPQMGTWIIKIEPKNLRADITIMSIRKSIFENK